MKNIILLLSIFLCITACKKDKKVKELKGITQTQGGKQAVVFEFSSGSNSQNIVYNAVVPYQTGTVLLKINYQLSYKNKMLTNALIEGFGSPIAVDYTSNTKNLITYSDFHGKRKNITYIYDHLDRLISCSGGDSSYDYVYNAQHNLEKVVYKNLQGGRKLEVIITTDELINPLYGTPLTYLEEDIPMWTWFSLAKHNITTLVYNYYDASGNNLVETIKYVYTYNYDEDGHPLTMKRYFYPEFLKGDKGYYEGFSYNY